MFLNDYGLTFMGESWDDREITMDPFIHKLYEPGGTNQVSYLPVYWHGHQILRLRVKACPSIKSVYIHIYMPNLEACSDNSQFMEHLFRVLPPLVDHGRSHIARITMEQ